MSEKEWGSFQAYDPNAELSIDSRCLPHWFQPGVAVFITFRTFDSMPQHVVQEWHEELKNWLRSKRQAKLIASEGLPLIEHLPPHLKSEYLKVRDRGWHQRLDECHGACLLRAAELRQVVVDTLLYFHRDRYDLDCLVVMPNHVHLIVQFRAGYSMRKEVTGWLRYSARKINAILGRRGEFWQSEPFDHLIRSAAQFEYLREYIANNPAKARLKPGESTVLRRLAA